VNKKIILVVGLIAALILGGIIFIRFYTAEDTWICKNGQWVKHGNPNASMPNGWCQND
jgi:hypothetical protein